MEDPVVLNTNGATSPANGDTVDAQTIVEYLEGVLGATLGASRQELEAPGSLLSNSKLIDTISRCTLFASESQVSLYVQKDVLEHQNGIEPHHNDAFLKRPMPINPSIPISSQVQVINLPGPRSGNGVILDTPSTTSPFETLHAVVQLALAPYFDACVKSQDKDAGRTNSDTRTGIPGTRKRLAELELSLQHLQEDSEIPEVTLEVHDVVQAALDEALARGTRPSVDQIPAELLADSQFANTLQSIVNGWIKSIQSVTKATRDNPRDVGSGTATQEINYWLSMEARIADIARQQQSDGVQLTIDILDKAKRYNVTTSFATDTGLKETADLVQRYNQIMRDFPLDELRTATSLERVSESVDQIFIHLNRKMRVSPYPIKRALALVEAISGDLDSRLEVILRGRELMHLPFSEFEARMRHTDNVWETWEESIKEFTNTARDLMRRRKDQFVPIRIHPRHIRRQDRVKYINTFRVSHEQLQRTIINVLGSDQDQQARTDGETVRANLDEFGDVDAIEEVAQAFTVLKDVDVLDISDEGTRIWAQAETTYNERTSRVENSIIARLRDRLATAKTANEMFRVFSRFNSLFVRPKIRGAISEYQVQLISSVKNDIAALHERFKERFVYSQAYPMAQLRDLPPVSGNIIWVRQIERQLNAYMGKVEDVLGSDWSMQIEGQKLHAESAMFRRKLDTRVIYDTWLHEVLRKQLTVSGRLFHITRNRAGGDILELRVNFDSQVITLFKEVRNLQWLSFHVPHAVTKVSKEAKRVYPYAVSLIESVSTYAQTNNIIADMSEISLLLSGYLEEAQSLVTKGAPLQWDSFVNVFDSTILQNSPTSPDILVFSDSKHVQFVRDFASSVSLLQNKVFILTSINETVQKALLDLQHCAFTSENFRKNLDVIQRAVDQLNLENYVNLAYWVAQTNEQVGAILHLRLQHAVEQWIKFFEGIPDIDEDDAATTIVPSFEVCNHVVTMRNQLIYLDPPLETARANLLSNLHNWLSVVCDLHVVQPSRYEMKLGLEAKAAVPTFSKLASRCVDVLSDAYNLIEHKLEEVAQYVDKWLQFQSLWDLQSEQVHDSLGEDLSMWLQLLQEIRKTRGTFDTSEYSRSFGHLSVHYEQVQTKVNAKYDQWQHEILVQFGLRHSNRITEVFSELEQARQDLEGQSLETSSTVQAVMFITTVQQCKRRVAAWEPEMDVFRQGQTALSRHRYRFPADWLYVDQVDHEWTALNEVLGRKSKIILDQTDALRAKVVAEDRLVDQKVGEITTQWTEQKPVSGTVPPGEASSILSSFDTTLSQLHDQAEMVSRAKEALDLPASPGSNLATLLEEVRDLKSVWASLALIWNGLNELRDQPWTSVQPRKLRQSLEDLIKMSKDMPSRMRQYAAFEHVQSVLRQLLKVNPLLSDMRADAVRERHWIRIFKALRPSKRYSQLSMTLGDVWDLQLGSSEPVIRDIIIQAQGEMALEEFLRQVRDTWQNYSLDLVNHRSKCRLIRGWDDLFAKCSENLNSLQAMRHSPYYREFEEEAASWEEKLNRVHVLFDVWIDVQRQWVYLEGVFTGNADIKHLLPMESSRFNNINTEFNNAMKKVYRSPLVLDVLNIPGIQKTLERLADLLSKIQKALGEYLERERVSFPRFYFAGDEDLLEIIGNSNDTVRIAKHLRKMFAGIADLVTDEDSNILGIVSKEGEQVTLRTPINIAKTPRVNEWLAALENCMKQTLAGLLSEAVDEFRGLVGADSIDLETLSSYISAYPAQIVVLATQACWTEQVDAALAAGGTSLPQLLEQELEILSLLATVVLQDLDPVYRKKCEHLITECVHQRDVIQKLIDVGTSTNTYYLWLLQMRYLFNAEGGHEGRLMVKMANASLTYGFEYLGVPDRLVRTPLTDRCFLTLTQALCQRLGGSPYGPAGTGKTETVKALGLQLGRFTLVFNCDDTFDFQSMGRIFLGICQVGAWGCFDEFNRLEERILSAVSQQLQNIQLGLKAGADNERSQIELVGRQLKVHGNTGMFITMNPGYAGRSNLPDNLKKLFRSVAMSKPDKELIAEVMLFSQGFSQAQKLARQTVPFFDKCAVKLSRQPHYDFGLRALKSVLVSSGGLKRARISTNAASSTAEDTLETQIVVQSLRETIAPKLIRADVDLLLQIELAVFPGVQYVPAALTDLRQAVRDTAAEAKLIAGDMWMTKVMQLYQIQNLQHGVMMVGSSGSGKSTVWRTLLQALQRVDRREGVCHVIDAKVMSKESLYGSMDSTTREWTDGLFTSILRKIVDNIRGEDAKRHWIVFDGDVDPEWVENLNSVLDDNKLLTLPNGERLNLPSNVRIMFEVETLKYATLATVSRCGMIWFSDDTVTVDDVISNYLDRLHDATFEDIEDEPASTVQSAATVLDTQRHVAGILRTCLIADDFIIKALSAARELNHIMAFTHMRALDTLFALLKKTCRSIMEYNVQHPDFPLNVEQIDAYLEKKVLLALVWSFAGDCPLAQRKTFGAHIAALTTLELPMTGDQASLIDYDVTLPSAQWKHWQSEVPTMDVQTHSVTQTDVVIPTLDTVRHEEVLYSWLAEHKPLLLCGPPGSGKTMTLFSALRKLPNMEVVGLNFSSATSPELLVKTIEQYCEYRKTLNGTILSPNQIGRWLVVFCDEINLPTPDKYGTQCAISFLRQLVEQNGFWRASTKTWISLERIQFVGACNPPTDVGRTPLSPRFLRHAPLLMVDYPGESSLSQIYGTFNAAVLKVVPTLRGYAEPLTKAMIQLYLESQRRFTAAIQPHYVYSPRELTRWVRGIYEAIKPLEQLTMEGLVRIWAHEALRLFSDRLIAEEERKWTEESVRRIALEHFPTMDERAALHQPILFSNWLSRNYIPVEQGQLRDFVKARLRTFCEEEVDVPLILFNDVLEHVLRIDRVFRQPQGHLILIGVSGSGKTTLSRFVAWMNGLKVFQIKVHGKYSSEDFDEDLRSVLRRCGCKGEKICFIMDESNVLDSGFLERMNTLLANGEVPGLFEGDEYASLMTSCKEGAQRQGLLLDSQEELYKWFTQQIVRNLHVVFTMNPPEDGLSSKAATSPALFNRCVLNWFGDWSDQALFQVGWELTQGVDLDRNNYAAPDDIPVAYRQLSLPPSHRDAVVNAMVHVHYSVHRFNHRIRKQQNKITYLTPRHFLDFVAQYVKLYNEKREDLEEQQRHLNVGLEKLRETVEKVRDLRKSLAEKKDQLEKKDIEANDKLKRMVTDQQEAEQRRAISLEISSALEKQEKEVAARREVVMNDLAEAEPAVIEAQKSVGNIKKQHLTEVRSMQNPPAGVKLALEAVCTLLGHKVNDWRAILTIVRREDFIASIVSYDNERQMTRTHRMKMQADYLSNGEFTYERVNRASKACGPLVQWVQAQVKYSEILDRVGPLREEVGELEEAALQTRAEAQVISNTVHALESSIATYKTEYAALISETQAIKTEMSRVQSKVDRSVRLLKSLSSERTRWEESSKSFETQIDTIVGDVLLAAAFVAYAGLFDQQYRKAMTEDWSQYLSVSNIKHKTHNPVAGYLSTADERLRWAEHSLPVDELCTENAVILKRFNRYPLIIDPSGRAMSFLQNDSQDRRLTVTSFLDDSFTKQLESALRFGNPILIQDAEHLDPILNHVLNKEYTRTGGRVLIQLGRQEIDFSPAFRLYLSTRDPSATFAPDVCSRTTFVNFTVTQSSLQTLSLDKVVKAERPDVDERRSNLVKMQGEFRLHLRHLEKELLRALNESRGNILDDDKVIQTLETLKQEASEISAKAAETDGVMAEVEAITQSYKVIAQSSSAIFAVLEQLHHTNHFYQFSLQYFIDIFESVLKRVAAGPRTSHVARVDSIVRDLFVSSYRRTSLSLLQKDRVTLAMLLAQAAPFKVDRNLIDLLLDDDIPSADLSARQELKHDTFVNIAKIRSLKDVVPAESNTAWNGFFSADAAERVVTGLISCKVVDLNAELRGLLLIKLCRVDRLVPAVERFVAIAFGESFFDTSDDLGEVVGQVSANVPIALSSSPGFDASYKVEHLVERTQTRCNYVAMGSSEGLATADKAVSNAAAVGSWVLVKNVHLAPAWLQNLEKRIDSLKPHPDFRLFLSMESSPKIPVNLLRASRILMYEQPAGIKANMKDSVSSLPIEAVSKPVEKTRVYFLLTFLHAVLQERLRYAPLLGWKGFWEFNDSDYACSVFVIDTWIDFVAKGRSNVAPNSIPWDMIRVLVTETYGGKVDNADDFEQLTALVRKYLDPAAFEESYRIVDVSGAENTTTTPPQQLPSGTSMKAFGEWVNRLPEREPPTYLGLPANAEKLLLVGHAEEMVRNLRDVMEMLDEGEQVMAEAQDGV
ncbi:dynein heavy chain [Elasticomyces elasticus]|nr:dynein heavy chain [Elasticomyces elasticus]